MSEKCVVCGEKPPNRRMTVFRRADNARVVVVCNQHKPGEWKEPVKNAFISK